MSDVYIISALISITVGLVLYLFLVPRRNFRDDDTYSDNAFVKAASIFGDELFSALPAGALRHSSRYPKIEALLRKSGNPWKIKPVEFIFITVVASILGGLAGLIFWAAFHFTGLLSIPLIIFILVGATVGAVFPYSKLKDLATERENVYRSELPEALDLITISLAGGRTFQSALRDSVPNMNDSILKDEFVIMLASLDTSKPLNECLQEFKERAPSESVRVFVQAVQESIALDVPLVHVLRSRAEDSRQELFSFIQDKVAALPTKLMAVIAPTSTISLLLLTAAPASVALISAL